MNFEKLFTDYNIEYSTKVNRGWVNVECPFCYSSTHQKHLGFNPYGDYCHCWKCGGKNIKTALSRLLSIPSNCVEDVMRDYRGRNIQLNNLNKKSKTIHKLELPTDTFLPIERKYLKSRNFNPKYLHDKYKIVGGGMTGKWKYRIIIPLILNNKIVSWTARSILDKEKLSELDIPRYKNLSIEESIYPPKDLFYNIDNCNGDTVVITEGAFDVMRLGDRFGNNDNVICSWGTTMTQSQISTLKNKFKKVYMMFDNEPEAQEKARKFGLQISAIGLDVEIVNFYEDFGVNDGAECTYEQVDFIRKELGL